MWFVSENPLSFHFMFGFRMPWLVQLLSPHLIHAATMVAAGIYLIAYGLTLCSHQALSLLAILGAGMGLYAGFCALVQRDIKKILSLFHPFPTRLHGSSIRTGHARDRTIST